MLRPANERIQLHERMCESIEKFAGRSKLAEVVVEDLIRLIEYAWRLGGNVESSRDGWSGGRDEAGGEWGCPRTWTQKGASRSARSSAGSQMHRRSRDEGCQDCDCSRRNGGVEEPVHELPHHEEAWNKVMTELGSGVRISDVWRRVALGEFHRKEAKQLMDADEVRRDRRRWRVSVEGFEREGFVESSSPKHKDKSLEKCQR